MNVDSESRYSPLVLLFLMINAFDKHTNTMHSVAKKVNKRKTDSPMQAKEIKVKKFDSSLKVKKSSTKAELICQLEELLHKYDALEKENHKNIDLIASLRENNGMFKKPSETCAKETQTENDFSLKCIECNFRSVSTEEWKFHMYENHGWPNIVEICENDRIEREPGLICKECKYKAEDIYDYDGHVWSEICTDPTVQKKQEDDYSISCEFCDEKFARLRELMHHKKKQHAENVKPCWNFASGKCEFGDTKCWFLHVSKSESSFECTSCDKIFPVKAKLLHHRKNTHLESVQTCSNMMSGFCKYGADKCWFKHVNNDKNDKKEKEDDNEEVIEKIFE